MLTPFLITLIVVVTWNNLIIGQNQEVANMIVCSWIWLFCIWTFVIEVVQLRLSDDLKSHFLDPWNIIDILNVLSLLFVSFMQVFFNTDNLPPYFWGINSLCSLIIWFKLFYFV